MRIEQVSHSQSSPSHNAEYPLASMPIPIPPSEKPQPPPSDLPDIDARLKDKDSTIERLQMQLMEQELEGAQARQVGDASYQTLQKDFMELQVKHAGVVEENNYFQMMLEKKMLKGDGPGFAAEPQETGMTSLAEEIDFEDVSEPQMEAIKKLEADNKYLREQNRALTIYVDKIVGRILQNPGYEHIIVGQDEEDTPPPPPAKPAPVASADKALPPPPGQENAAAGPVQSAMAGFLQRTRSVGKHWCLFTTPLALPTMTSSPSQSDKPYIFPTSPEVEIGIELAQRP